MGDVHRETEPFDRLTRITNRMLSVAEADPEWDAGDKMIIFMDAVANNKSGLALHGYDDDLEAVAHLFMHMRAIFRANGKDLMMAPYAASQS